MGDSFNIYFRCQGTRWAPKTNGGAEQSVIRRWVGTRCRREYVISGYRTTLQLVFCFFFSNIVGAKQRAKHEIGSRGDSGKVSKD